MAFMIPQNVKEFKTEGEKQFYTFLVHGDAVLIPEWICLCLSKIGEFPPPPNIVHLSEHQ